MFTKIILTIFTMMCISHAAMASNTEDMSIEGEEHDFSQFLNALTTDPKDQKTIQSIQKLGIQNLYLEIEPTYLRGGILVHHGKIDHIPGQEKKLLSVCFPAMGDGKMLLQEFGMFGLQIEFDEESSYIEINYGGKHVTIGASAASMPILVINNGEVTLRRISLSTLKSIQENETLPTWKQRVRAAGTNI